MNIDEILKQAALIVADELEAGYRLFLFGSRAKGTCDDKSDIDIGIHIGCPNHWKAVADVIQEELEPYSDVVENRCSSISTRSMMRSGKLH